jgi:glycosyltransferase involved in cell wall biosynthesis
MKICLVSLDFAPFRTSGLAVYAENLAAGLSGLGHRVTVIASAPSAGRLQEIQRLADQIVRIPAGRTSWIGYAYRASRLLRELEKETSFDVVHFADVHFAYAYRGAYIASVHQSFRQRLVAADGLLPYHSSLANLLSRYVYYNLARLLAERPSLRRASRLIAVSQATRDDFVHHYGVRAGRVDVVLEGIDTRFFRPADPRGLRERLGLGNQPVLLYVGFSTPRKGLEYLGRALCSLDLDVRLVIVGRWEKGYRERFLRSVGDRSHQVIELGYVPDHEMPLYYSLADVLVLPSLLEGFGLPLVEAMACATPVVATTVGSIPEVVGDAGLLVPARDHLALAESLHRLLCDRALLRDLGSRGRQRAEAHFTRERMATDTIAVYARYLRGPR